ncbi:allantoate amidohydrolase [Rhizomonospora bruguierae]|uniref:allantoate amidohydrolase n=1 Tax=Rhizomonospora bruguierae TaxID=1581705 RepID=UPI001BCC2C26|nr:allantoate amidohydrolase [Micromonospora sp. NBRC 107566]
MTPERFRALWSSLLPIGLDRRTGGYFRYGWSDADLACREWFAEEAADRGMDVAADGNGNLIAWWGSGGPAVLTGSHFDSVPNGGAYDGPLGIVSAFLAVDLLRERGAAPAGRIGIAAFAEEEGARFGVACLGSRLMTGALAPERALALRDGDGVSLGDALTKAGADPARLGPSLPAVDAYVELHVEQGRLLSTGEHTAPVGVASAIWPHGRWRLDLTGEGNHAGTTRMADRCDPMLTLSYAILAANKEARLRGAHATVGRVEVTPNATNAIPPSVSAWLDARAAQAETLDGLVEAVAAKVTERAGRDGTSVAVTAESVSPAVEFDGGLRDRVAALLRAPILPTGAGHDAGVLSAHVPTAMLFVRNPTGVSHAPAERATDADCAAGVTALADVLQDLACR